MLDFTLATRDLNKLSTERDELRATLSALPPSKEDSDYVKLLKSRIHARSREIQRRCSIEQMLAA